MNEHAYTVYCERGDCPSHDLPEQKQGFLVTQSELVAGQKMADDGTVLWFCPACCERPLTRPERYYHVYCGNYECSTRLAFRTHYVADHDLGDGEVWLCPDCRKKAGVLAP